MDQISLDEFKKVNIRIGKVISAEKVEGSNKLLKLLVDFNHEKRQILAGIAKFYEPETLIGKLCPFVFNLESKKMGELESQGMILAVDDSGPVLLHPDKEVDPGSMIK